MKKYLMTGIAALAMCAAFTSCSHDPGFEQTTPEQLAQAQYDAAFIKAFGQPAANQDWGFGTNLTRSAETNSNQWGTMQNNGKYKDVLKMDDIPAITADELRDVLAVFNQKGEETYTSLIEWDTFFVQQVWKGTAVHKDGYGQDVVGGNQMNWLCAYDPVGHTETVYLPENNYSGTQVTNHDDHVNNFNAANGFVMLMMNSSTQRFGYSSSSDNGHVFYYFRMEKINGMYYVGFDFSAEGQNPNEQVQRDYIYNDWIVKIIPGAGYSTTSNYRVIAEDLNASEKTDFDFNDVVFDIIPNGTTSADIKAIAAGGIYKLTVNGVEVHEAFGESVKTDGTYPMINTGAGPTHDPVVLCTINGDFTGADAPAKIKNIVIKVYKPGFEENGIALEATTGKPACKILVDDTFGVVPEREDISNEYKNFTKYVGGQFVDEFWWK